jgi:hypothetical protein
LCLLQWKATHKMGSSLNLKDKVGARIHLGNLFSALISACFSSNACSKF